MQKLRLFVAINLDQETRDRLAGCVERLQARLSGRIRWVPQENYHLTLKFLGDTSTERIAEVDRALSEALSSCSPFGFDVQGLGCFPSISRPRVLWAGLSGYSDLLDQVAAAVEGAAISTGYKKERRPFHPHITLARINAIHAPEELGQACEEHADWFGGDEWVNSVELMQSDLGRGGASYQKIASYSLR